MTLLDFQNKDAKYFAKLKRYKNGAPYIEIRTGAAMGYCQILMIVSLDGFPNPYTSSNTRLEANVKFSQNGTSYFTWEEIEKLNQVVQEAKVILEGIKNGKTDA